MAVRLVAKPTVSAQHGPARLLTISHNNRRANLVIGHEREDLVVRVRRDGSDRMGRPPLVLHDVFEAGERLEIGVRIADGALTAAIDGRPAGEFDLGDGALATWDGDALVSLGDEVTGNRPWRGVLSTVTVTVEKDRVDYLVEAALRVPERPAC